MRLTNRTSVYDLLPILVEKFSIPSDNNYALYEGYETGTYLADVTGLKLFIYYPEAATRGVL